MPAANQRAGTHIRETTPADPSGVRRVVDAAWHDAHEPIVGTEAVRESLDEYYGVEALHERYRNGDSPSEAVVGYASGVPGGDDGCGFEDASSSGSGNGEQPTRDE